jgi:hypothetical protein
MKPKDKVIIQQGLGEVTEVHENGFCTVTMPNGEGHRLYLYECMMYEEYREIKPLSERIKNAYRWLFSNKFDAFLSKLFFKTAKLFFVFCCALLVSLPFILLLL